MLVVIDGPSGAGKSTVSRRLARELGFAFLDTGAMYRAVALAAQRAGLDPDDFDDLTAWLDSLDIQATPADGRFLVALDGDDVEPFIRNEAIGDLASRLSARPEVRAYLLAAQQEAGRRGSLVAEGRDTGTIVFPRAEVKVFLTASAEERARRRLKDLLPKQPEMTLERVMADMARRDQRDRERSTAPLSPAAGALELDSTDLDEDQVVALLLKRARQGGQP